MISFSIQMNRTRTVVGFLGTTLDRGRGAKRWNRWRPTMGACTQPDLPVDRLDLLYQGPWGRMAQGIARDLAEVAPATEVVLQELAAHDPWDFEQVYAQLLDYARTRAYDPDTEDLLVHISTGSHVAQICLFLLTESRHLPGQLLQTSPQKGDEAQPQGKAAVIDLDLSRYDAIARRFEEEQRQGESLLKHGIATRNPAYNHLIGRLEQVALRSTRPVLLQGPTGAGKSLLARKVHALRASRRLVSGSYVELNCATIRGDGAMSTLFGHTRGAYTGAQRDRPGVLREANGGTLFLDEIGELGGDEQAMLLRALEEKRFLPLGSDREVSSDFQLVAGTNRDLRDEVAAGRFREDLLARIDTWTFTLPALRDRPEDIAPNVAFELDRFARDERRRVTFNKEARERFLGFATGPGAAWSRNFRDLGSAVARMATLAPGGRITVEEVDEEIGRLRHSWAVPGGEASDEQLCAEVLGVDDAAELDPFDAVQLALVIRVCRRSRTLSEAGRTLFARSRLRRSSTNDADRLRKYLAKHGLEFRQVTRPQLV